MSYDHGKTHETFRIATGEQIIATQTPAVKASIFGAMQPLAINGFSAVITTAMTVTAAVVQLKHRPTPGSASGEVIIASLTLPVTGSAIGDCVYKKFDTYKVPAGAEVVAELITASTAGAAVFGIELNSAQEAPANNLKMKLSA